MSEGKFIVYYRVPAQPHVKFGLGLEPQRIATMVFLESRGGILVGEYIEVEDASRQRRPELDKALQSCREVKATLFIPRLGKLVHDLTLVESLLTSGVYIEVGDLSRTNMLDLYSYTALAEIKANRTLELTKKVLLLAGSGRADSCKTSVGATQVK